MQVGQWGVSGGFLTEFLVSAAILFKNLLDCTNGEEHKREPDNALHRGWRK